MKLTSLLSSKFIITDANVNSIEAAIELLLNKLMQHYSFSEDKEKLIDTIFAREKQGGTLFPTGIAIPHARLESFDDVVIGICIPRKPFVVSEILVRMIVLIVTSKTAPKLYLNSLAAFLEISKDEAFFSKILSSESSDDIIDTIEKYGIRVKKELTIADIMETEFVKVPPETTLEQLTDIFLAKDILYAPVVDGNDNFIGEINAIDLLKFGLPNYISLMENLNFLKSLEPFEKLLNKESDIPVRDIMRKPSMTMNPDTSVIELTFEIVQNRVMCFPVVDRDGKLVGIVTVYDILSKVIRG